MRLRNPILRIVAVAALAASLILGGVVPAYAAGGSVSGTVTLGAAGTTPGAGLTVYLSPLSRLPLPTTEHYYQETTTDGRGHYSFPIASDGDYFVQVAPPVDGSYAAPLSSGLLQLNAQNPKPVVDFTLNQLGATLSGRVTSAQDGTPVAGAQVVADGPVLLYATTAADGTYTIRGLAGGTYTPNLTAPHYYRDDYLDPVTLAIGGSSTLDLTMNRLSRISGRVTSLTDSAPIAGIRVTYADPFSNIPAAQGVTGADGTYLIETRPIARNGRVTFTDPNGAYSPVSAGEVRLSVGQDAPGTDARLGRPTDVSGTLLGTDAAKTPVVGATVTFTRDDGQTQSASTDPTGGYIVYSLPPGAYEVQVRTPFASPFDLVDPVAFTVTGASSTQTLDLAARPKGAVQGTITVPGATSASPASVQVIIEHKSESDDGITYVDKYTQTVQTTAGGKATYLFPSVAPELQNYRSDPSWQTADYVISATVLSGGVGADQYPRTFWRSTADQKAAATFEVPLGGARTVLDIAMLTPRAFTTAPVPSIEGEAAVGSTLTVQRGAWSPTPKKYSYAWAANDVVIPGATSTSYTVQPSDVGKRITFRVTGTKPGYATTTRTSAAVGPVRGTFSATTSFLTALYQDYLGRTPSASEISFWSAKLTPGVPRSVVSDGFVNSDEYRLIRIDAAYRTILGREPDASGRADWLKAMRQGAITTDDIETSFYASQEWYVTHGGTDSKYAAALYQALLGRAGTSSDYRFWADIVSKQGRAYAIDQFWDANETISKRVSAMYAFYLGRTPDAPGLASWVGLALRIGDSGLRSGFTSSEEYYKRAAVRFPG